MDGVIVEVWMDIDLCRNDLNRLGGPLVCLMRICNIGLDLLIQCNIFYACVIGHNRFYSCPDLIHLLFSYAMMGCETTCLSTCILCPCLRIVVTYERYGSWDINLLIAPYMCFPFHITLCYPSPHGSFMHFMCLLIDTPII